jgi:hypothetical protein
LLRVLHVIDHLDRRVDIIDGRFGWLCAVFVEFKVEILSVKVVSLVEDAASMGRMLDCHPIAPDEDRP